MIVGIANTPRDYAWGSDGEISSLLGMPPTGKPEAELWLGAHPASPSKIVAPARTNGAADLAEWIAADPATSLGDPQVHGLPFLLKVLAARSPLSLQAHPSIPQAIAGFARENELGIPIDAPNRNYRDENHKPELIVAVSEHFDALCGFRSAGALRETIDTLLQIDAAVANPNPVPLRHLLERVDGDASIRPVFEWLISRGDGVDELITRVSVLADDSTIELQTAARLAQTYPGDPGVVISLMLNTARLARGQALYLPAGNIHAYLSGVGIELMASSDNVLRGGLTPKHVDVAELVSVLDFRPVPVPFLAPTHLGDHVVAYRPDVPEFQLISVDGPGTVVPVGASIALCTGGRFSVSGAQSTATLSTGSSVFITPDEGTLSFSGSGQVFVATTQRRPAN